MKRVLIIQSEVKRYRKPFFLELHSLLQTHNIILRVLYSESNSDHALRGDSDTLPEAVGRCIKGLWLFKRFLYQPVWREVFRADLVVIGPEIKYLNNPLLLLLRALGLKRVAFWGLGPNRHATRSPLAEFVKRPFFTSIDWWFAYTRSIAEWLQKEGMPAARITDVQNSTDTTRLREELASISDEEAALEKRTLCGPDGVVGLYCGFLGQIKAIPLLVDTARKVHARRPEFHLVIIGDGPDKPWLLDAIQDCPWIHYLGSKFGRESALYYRLADVFIMAGAAGLAVVDSFAAGLPLLATDIPAHPPEISYVINGENGLLAPPNSEQFAEAITKLLDDPSQMKKLQEGARQAGSRYTIHAMADRFCLGIMQCLELRDSKAHRSVAEPASSTTTE